MERKVQPRIPSGFMELLPGDQIIFNKMFDTIKRTYESFGFVPIETPAIEFTEVLLTKSGGETEKQVYRLDKQGSDLSLHFDLTVPLARYVAEHYRDLVFPFRRYQMQKVWRGERKQRGRFREFYQCDIDVIGTSNIMTDAEIPSIIYKVFCNLNIGSFTIRINNRKILNGFMDYLGISNMSRDVLRSIDKLEKQGEMSVYNEMSSLGVSGDKVSKMIDFVKINGNNDTVLTKLNSMGVENDLFKNGINELRIVLDTMDKLGVPSNFYCVDLSIARGLDYYTGTVYETILNEHPTIGSVCSGGRFDNLAEHYTDEKLPGVGISIGLTRLFYNLKDCGIIKPSRLTSSKVLVAQMDKRFIGENLKISNKLRENGINTEMYFEQIRLGKQFKYAEQLKIPFVVVVGDNELSNNLVSLKEMNTGNQYTVSLDEAIKIILKYKGD